MSAAEAASVAQALDQPQEKVEAALASEHAALVRAAADALALSREENDALKGKVARTEAELLNYGAPRRSREKAVGPEGRDG